MLTSRELMDEFAVLTGLSPGSKRPRKRYLWTDAFGVCNFLGLFQKMQDQTYMDLALRLVDQVHTTLGRHRADDPRSGWISGLEEREGSAHPTKGGLRIGKEMNERGPDEPVDERLEWDRDGQYFHYLTKWMHALNRVSRVAGDSKYNRWAVELAKGAHAGFTYTSSSEGPKRMYWKMSIDLAYPLVASMGHHDPLDGFITYCQLQGLKPEEHETSTPAALDNEIADMAEMCRGRDWTTADPLGLGELLSNAFKVGQLTVIDRFRFPELLESLLDSALGGLGVYAQRSPLMFPAHYRLAFRELGLSIGLEAVERLNSLIREDSSVFGNPDRLLSRIEELRRYRQFGEDIERFWTDPANRSAPTWGEHREINMVMLATCLSPDGYLSL